MIAEMIKDVIMSVALDMPSDTNRSNVARLLSKTVFAGMPVTDITTPEEVENLVLVYVIDMPHNGQQKVLQIETANAVLDRDNIKIKIQ